jgi:hypothetical protein
MLLLQYTHRLPSDYEMSRVRERAAKRGRDWDNAAGLVFKAFLIQEKRKHGAAANAYSSLYLWRSAEAAADLIAGERFQAVIDAFGRPSVETFLVLAASLDGVRSPRFVSRADQLVATNQNLVALKKEEQAHAEELTQTQDASAALTGLDVTNWRLSWFILSREEPSPDASQASFEIEYLARPA